jgi:polyisoprenoid-binding protein YceI
MPKVKTVTWLIALAALSASCTSAWASPPAWQVDAAKSSLTFKVLVNNQTVTGKFPGFGALIRFDPADLAGSSAKITMDTTGIKTNDKTRDAMLLKPAWFNVLDFPQAKFQCDRFVSTGPGKFVCEGKLTIKSIARPVNLPFTLDIRSNRAFMKGTTTIKRLDFKVGEGPDFASGVPVALTVDVFVDLQATRVNAPAR